VRQVSGAHSHANLAQFLRYLWGIPSDPSSKIQMDATTHVQSMHLAIPNTFHTAILCMPIARHTGGAHYWPGGPSDTAENSRQTGPRVGKRLGPVGPPPSPHPKSRHMWLTLTGLPESNQPFAERHSLNDNANHLLHYLACASVRKRKESALLIKLWKLLLQPSHFCHYRLLSWNTFHVNSRPRLIFKWLHLGKKGNRISANFS
jgi:hypothetical protein